MSVRRYQRNNRMSPWQMAQLAGSAYNQYGIYSQQLNNAAKVGKAARSYLTQSSKPLPSKKYQKKKKKKKYQSKTKEDIKQCKKALKNLKVTTDQSTGTLTYRTLSASRILCIANEQASADIGEFTTTEIEAAIANFKYFNPATPGTLTTANPASATFQQNIQIKSATTRIVCRNNYQTDVTCKIYRCQAKDDTNQSVRDLWTAALTDGGDAGSINKLPQYLSDYDAVKDLYTCKLVSKTNLSPGQSVSASWTGKGFEYSPSTVDTHSLVVQREYQGGQFIVVIQGTLGHDNTANEQGFVPCGVDISTSNTYVLQYDAGINIKYIAIDSSGLDSFTNADVQSHEPTSNNQSYSVA